MKDAGTPLAGNAPGSPEGREAALAAEVAGLIRDGALLPVEGGLGPDTDLYERGLDSMSMMQVLLAVEERYGVTLPDGALTRDTFATPASLARVLAPLVDDARAGV